MATERIELVLIAQVRGFTKGLTDAEKSVKGLRDASKTAARNVQTNIAGMATKVGASAKKMVRNLLSLRTAFLAVATGAVIKKTVDFAANFEKALANVDTLLVGTNARIEDYRKELIELSKVTSKDLIDLTTGLYQAISAGVPAIEGPTGALAALEQAQLAAVAGLTETRVAMDGIISVTNAYRDQALGAADASDKLFTTVRLGRVTFEQLSTNIGKVAGTAATFGVSTDDLLGSLASLSRVIPSTEQSVTSLQAIIKGIVTPTGEAAAEFARLGVDASAAGLANVGLVETLRQIRVGVGEDKDALAALFPNIRALRGAAVLLGTGFEDVVNFSEQLADSTGATQAAFEKIQPTLSEVSGRFKSQLIAVLTEAGTRVLPQLKAAFEDAGKFFEANTEKIADGFEALIDGLLGVGRFIAEDGAVILSFLADVIKLLQSVFDVGQAFLDLAPGTTILDRIREDADAAKSSVEAFTAAQKEAIEAFAGPARERAEAISGTSIGGRRVREAVAEDPLQAQADAQEKFNDLIEEAERRFEAANVAAQALAATEVETTRQIAEQQAQVGVAQAEVVRKQEIISGLTGKTVEERAESARLVVEVAKTQSEIVQAQAEIIRQTETLNGLEETRVINQSLGESAASAARELDIKLAEELAKAENVAAARAANAKRKLTDAEKSAAEARRKARVSALESALQAEAAAQQAALESQLDASEEASSEQLRLQLELLAAEEAEEKRSLEARTQERERAAKGDAQILTAIARERTAEIARIETEATSERLNAIREIQEERAKAADEAVQVELKAARVRVTIAQQALKDEKDAQEERIRLAKEAQAELLASTTGAGARARGRQEAISDVAGAVETPARFLAEIGAEEASTTLQESAGAIALAVGPLVAAVVEAPAIFNAIGDLLTTGLSDFIGSLGDSIFNLLFGLIEGLPEQLITILTEQIPDFIQTLIGELPRIIGGLIAAIPRIVNAFISAIPEIIVGFVLGFRDAGRNIFDFIVENTSEAFREAISRAFEPVADFFRQIIAPIAAIFRDVANAFKRAGEAIEEVTGGGEGEVSKFFTVLGARVGIKHDGGMIRGGSNPSGAAVLAAAGAQRFQKGGSVRSQASSILGAALGGDDVPIIAQAGEAVLSRGAGVPAAGGEAGVAALNAGVPLAGGGVSVAIQPSGNAAMDALIRLIIGSVTVSGANPLGAVRQMMDQSQPGAPAFQQFVPEGAR